MGGMPWVVLCWPGLPSVWRRGAWSGLMLAVGFAGLVNLGLLTSLVWRETELFTPGVRNMVWLAVGLVWIGSAIWTVDSFRRHPDPDRPRADEDTFAAAQRHYLKQDWYEAERIVSRLLRRRPRDIEALLLAASIARRTGRLDDAARRLERLGRIEGARAWDLEIRRERELLARAVQDSRETDVEAEAAEGDQAEDVGLAGEETCDAEQADFAETSDDHYDALNETHDSDVDFRQAA